MRARQAGPSPISVGHGETRIEARKYGIHACIYAHTHMDKHVHATHMDEHVRATNLRRSLYRCPYADTHKHTHTYIHTYIQQLVFEDSPSGARAGAASGAFTIGVLSSQTASALSEVCAWFFFCDVLNVPMLRMRCVMYKYLMILIWYDMI